MKIKTFTFLASIILVSVSCNSADKNDDRYSEEQIEKLEYLENHNISLNMLKSGETNGEDCNTVCCDTLMFCGVTKKQILPWLTHYRNTNWMNSSDFFRIHPTTNIGQTMVDLNSGNWQRRNSTLADPYSDAKSFDARFMDIPIAELENYLCYLRNSPATSQANTCRFYYMKYKNDSDIRSDYHNKHTLAIVPALLEEVAGEWVTTKEFTEDSSGVQLNSIYTLGARNCKKTPMANHNRLCPPFKGCTDGTMVEEIDKIP